MSVKRLSVFVVLVESKKTGNRFPYYEEAFTAQEAVNHARTYIPDDDEIVFVFKQVENWR